MSTVCRRGVGESDRWEKERGREGKRVGEKERERELHKPLISMYHKMAHTKAALCKNHTHTCTVCPHSLFWLEGTSLELCDRFGLDLSSTLRPPTLHCLAKS